MKRYLLLSTLCLITFNIHKAQAVHHEGFISFEDFLEKQKKEKPPTTTKPNTDKTQPNTQRVFEFISEGEVFFSNGSSMTVYTPFYLPRKNTKTTPSSRKKSKEVFEG